MRVYIRGAKATEQCIILLFKSGGVILGSERGVIFAARRSATVDDHLQAHH